MWRRAILRPTRPQTIPYHDNYEKWNSCFSIRFFYLYALFSNFYTYGATLETQPPELS